MTPQPVTAALAQPQQLQQTVRRAALARLSSASTQATTDTTTTTMTSGRSSVATTASSTATPIETQTKRPPTLPRHRSTASYRPSATSSRQSSPQGEAAFWFTLRGWSDGQPYVLTRRTSLDRWEMQAAERITLHFSPRHSQLGHFRLRQNPNSEHLGGYMWTCGVVMCFLVEDFLFKGNANVVELGAGVTCLPSLAWSRCGARRIIATDIPELIGEAKQNVWENRFIGGGIMTPAMTPAMTPYASPSMAAATLSPRAMPAFSPLASPALPASDAAPKHATIMQPLQLGGAAVSRRQSQEAAAASLGSTASTPEAMLAAMKLSAAAVVNATGAPTSMNSTAATCPITVIPLKWRQGMTPAQLPVELGGTVVTSTSPKLQPFDPLDVITMCDCIYSEASAIALVDTIHALCERNLQAGAPPPAIHCLSEVRNASAQEMFVEVAEGRGFNVRLVAVDEWHPRVPEECRSDHMNLYLLSWQGAAEEVEVKGQ